MAHAGVRLALAAFVAGLLGYPFHADASTAASSVAPATPAVVLCVEDTTRIPAAVRAAVAELDTAPEVSATHRRGVGCTGNAIRVMQTRLPKTAAGIVDPDTDLFGLVKITNRSRLYRLGDHEKHLVVLHELLHVVLGNPGGAGWDDGGHVDRCDSILSHDSACVLRLDGLTGFDRREIAREHRKEAPTP